MSALWTGTADLHMHTTASDGFAPVHEVLDYIVENRSLNVIAITDHDVIDASLWAYEHRAKYPFDVVPGVEVTSRGGHVLALWVTRPIPRYMSLKETVAAIHEQGGLAILAHPFELFVHPRASWHYYKQPQALLDAGLDAIEVHNSGAPTPFAGRFARRMGQQTQLPQVGNSDAHILTCIGCGITRFNGQTASELRHAIARGETQAEGAGWPMRDYLKFLPDIARRKSYALLHSRSQ